ncbi:GntR family transcriptional regulator [Psychrobacillus sp. FJAT-51614]|uniref:GntR family transcriptional regulator n=1 Tax=Psychrobacillus mangrovi TaxID=3117745 RepID=A0ABU8EZF2_9BACI
MKKGTTLKNQVYDYLKEQIIMGRLNPGERLIEEKISEELQVSRSPIRESIRMLEKDGLLHVNASGGVTVVEPTIQDYQQLFECRVEMEPLAAFYAAQRRSSEQVKSIRTSLLRMGKITEKNNIKKVHDSNEDFHEAIVTSSGNKFLVSMISQFRGVNSFYRKSILEENPYHAEHVIYEHQQIFQAIVDQDAELAKSLMRDHIMNDYKLFMEYCSKTREE